MEYIKGCVNMKVKFDYGFKIDDDAGEVLEDCKIDVYIDCSHKETIEYIKNSLRKMCNDFGNFVYNTKI